MDGGHDVLNDLVNVRFDFVFPDPNNRPTKPPKRASGILVPPFVPHDLGYPEECIRLRQCSVPFTAMPEATIYEDGDAKPRKYDIRCARQARSGSQSIAVSGAMQSFSQRKLWSCTRASHSRHQQATLFRREEWKRRHWLLELQHDPGCLPILQG